MAPLRDPAPTDASRSTSLLDGPALARAFRGAADALAAQTEALNAINVFPVPDGDTGINMSMTMRAAVDGIADVSSAAAVAKAVADGALMGARGNSGVILSQILAGFAAAFGARSGDDGVSGAALADALERGRESAYRVISNPKEGTILTAITGATEAARTAATAEADAEATLAAAVEGAREAVARTPELLPVLREAGVVDAGAQGLYVALDGMLRALRGEEIAAPEDLGSIDAEWLAATRQAHDAGEAAGFCTQFLIEAKDGAIDAGALRARLAAFGDSVLVVGGDALVRVHLHTHAPDEAIEHARSFGAVSQTSATDMEQQFRGLAGSDSARTRTAAVAVGAGEGIEALFRSLGASVVRGGQTMNPSAGEIRDAIEATGARDVIVLPNNKNIVLAAEQAAASLAKSGAELRVRVVPSRSIPQGVAALVAMNPEAAPDENVAVMTGAIGAIHTGEVTLAARATRIGGLAVREGQPIGIVDGELVVAESSVDEAALGCARRMLSGGDAAIVTLYRGEGVEADASGALAARLGEEFGCEVEVVDGGQPHYPYLIGVE